jgi:HlyD family secretion protein
LALSGIVGEVLVEEGTQVAAGDLLLRLSANQQQAALAQAQANLQRAQAQLQQLTAAPRTQEVAVAEAALNAAKARYQRLAAAALPGNIAAAEAAVNAAQAGLAKVLEGTSEQQLIAARADLANAEAVLRQAQRAYDRVKWSNEIGALPESAALQTATNNFEAAQARLADLQSGPSQADVAGASAQVRQAQAQLNTLQAAMPDDLVAAEADVQAAQAQLDLLQAGARTEAIAVAEADVAAATAALQQALVALGETELRAPFAGTVAELTVEPGEQASPGVVLVRLADLAQWEVETEDLTELDVVGLQAGAEVALAFDAIPDLTMNGAVKRIRPIGEDNRGDIVYTVVIAPAQTDSRFLWNMTTAVTLAR